MHNDEVIFIRRTRSGIGSIAPVAFHFTADCFTEEVLCVFFFNFWMIFESIAYDVYLLIFGFFEIHSIDIDIRNR